MVGHPPAAVATFNEVNEAREIARIAIIIASKKIPMFVKGEFFGVPDADGENFKVGAIGVTPHNRSVFGLGELGAFLGLDVNRPVSNGEVEFAVWAEAQAVHIVATEGKFYAESAEELFFDIGNAVVVFIGKVPEVGNASIPD